MKYKHAIIIDIPKEPKFIYDEALTKSFHYWVDEKGTINNPSIWQRQQSKLTYEEAFNLISNNKPHWVISFRNVSYISLHEKDYWEFGGCNMKSNDYGDVFIWIQVDVGEAEKIFTKFGLIKNEY